MSFKEKTVWVTIFGVLAVGVNLAAFNRTFRPSTDKPFEVLIEDDQGNLTEVTQQHVH